MITIGTVVGFIIGLVFAALFGLMVFSVNASYWPGKILRVLGTAVMIWFVVAGVSFGSKAHAAEKAKKPAAVVTMTVAAKENGGKILGWGSYRRSSEEPVEYFVMYHRNGYTRIHFSSYFDKLTQNALMGVASWHAEAEWRGGVSETNFGYEWGNEVPDDVAVSEMTSRLSEILDSFAFHSSK